MRSEFGPTFSERLAQGSTARQERIRALQGKVSLVNEDLSPVEKEQLQRTYHLGWLISAGAPAIVLLAALSSACGSDGERVPIRTPSPLTVAPTATLSSETPTIPATKTGTVVPTATATETETVTDTPTPTETETQPTPTAETLFTKEFWDQVFYDLDQINFTALNPDLLPKKLVTTLKVNLHRYADRGDYMMFLRQVLDMRTVTERYNDHFQWDKNPPEEIVETKEHEILRTKVVGPIVENINIIFREDESKLKQVQTMLEDKPVEWNQDIWKKDPYKKFVDLADGDPHLGSKDKKLWRAGFKLDLSLGNFVGTMDGPVQFYCEQGLETDYYLRDNIVIPYLQVIVNGDFSDHLKDRAKGYLKRCGVGVD